MNLGNRSKLSLCQFLVSVHRREELILLLQKHGLRTDDLEWQSPMNSMVPATREALLAADEDQLAFLLQELARTCGAIRTEISPRYKFDERWDDLCRCLELDGYAFARADHQANFARFVPIEPTIAGTSNPEDDLGNELESSGLAGSDAVAGMLERSATAFLNGDFNGCLSNARVALESLARAIAEARQARDQSTIDAKKWGQILSYLRSTGFIDERQEKALAGVYGFISDGAHRPAGFSDQEFARLGRTLALNFCYFLVKRWNAD